MINGDDPFRNPIYHPTQLGTLSTARAPTSILSIDRQNINAFSLVPTVAVTEQAVFPVVGMAGNSLQYIPTGSTYPVRVEVAFDVKSSTPAFSELQPGMVLKTGATGFSSVIIRVTKLYGILTIAAGEFLGTIVIATDYEHNAVGASPFTAVWTRSAPSVNSFGTRSLVGIGVLGIFSFRDTLPGLIEQNYQIAYNIENNGGEDIYIGSGPAIVVDSAGNRSLVRKIPVGGQLAIVRSGIPPQGNSTTPTTDDIFIYSENLSATAGYTFTARSFR